MAFALEAIVGSTSLSLSDKNPYRLLSVRGAGSAEVRRVTVRGPAQHGDSDRGYRLAPRTIELQIGFTGSSGSERDSRRDTLTRHFKPLGSTPVKLRFTRDDSEIRQLDCYTVGPIKFDLVPEFEPGVYHRATITLSAPNPAYYELTSGTVTATGTATLSGDWWLAGGAIGSANVLMSGTSPSPGANWSYAGTLGTTSPWTLAWRTGPGTGFVFGVDNNNSGTIDAANSNEPYFFRDGLTEACAANGFSVGTAMPSSGTLNYFLFYSGGASYLGGLYRTHITLPSLVSLVESWHIAMPISGTARKWRTTINLGTAWTPAIPLYALYNIELSSSQMAALNNYMEGVVGGTISQALAIPYEGDLPTYPTISIRGPITGATLTNTATGDRISFGTIAIGAGTTYTINTDPLFKTVLQGAVNKRGELSSDSNLGDWHIAPAPIATGGTNVISVSGTNVGTATQVSIVYTNRYTSY